MMNRSLSFVMICFFFVCLWLCWYPVKDTFFLPDYESRYRIISNGEGRYKLECQYMPFIWSCISFTESYSRYDARYDLKEEVLRHEKEWKEEHQKWSPIKL